MALTTFWIGFAMLCGLLAGLNIERGNSAGAGVMIVLAVVYIGFALLTAAGKPLFRKEH